MGRQTCDLDDSRRVVTSFRPRDKDATIVARFVNSCWRLFKLGAILALVAAGAVGIYLYARMDDEIRIHIQRILDDQYPQLKVSVGGARLVEGKGIAVYDVSLADPTGPGGELLLAIDELLLQCDVDLPALVRGALDVRRIEVRHPQLALRRNRAGIWNIARLLPSKPCPCALPQVIIRNGVATVADEAVESASPLGIRDVYLTITPLEPGDSVAFGLPAMSVEGTCSGPQAKRMTIHGRAGGSREGATLELALDQFQINAALLAWFRPFMPPAMQSARLGGVIDGTISAAWAQGATKPAVQAAVQLRDGRVDDPRLPQSITDISGEIHIDGARLQVTNVRGKCGGATLAVSLNRHGWTAAAPLALSARADNVTLDGQLYRSLADAGSQGLAAAELLRDQWSKFRPAGMVVEATLQATFDGQIWKPIAKLKGEQLAFESDKFAYRLNDGSGTITFSHTDGKPPTLDVNLVARTGGGGGQPVSIKGQVIDPRPGAAFWLDITGADIEIEPAMINALEQDKTRQVINQLNPAGQMNVLWHIERRLPGERPHTRLRLDLTSVRINYERFPYQLRGIQGVIEAIDGVWTFRDLASGGRPVVRGQGSLRPVPEGAELDLQLAAEQAPLDDYLFDALVEAPAAQQAWTQLRPRGQIDFVAHVRYRTGQPKPSIAIDIDPRPESTQLKPAFFPYLMEGVAGTIKYRDGQVELVDMRATNDRTRLRTNGAGYFAPDGSWSFQLAGLTADHVLPEPELFSAMPRQLAALAGSLKPTGTFNLHDGVIEFRKRAASSITPLEIEWDVEIECHQTDLHCGIDLQNIHGSVRLAGMSDGARSYSTGELLLESVTFQDVQLTNVRGPLWADESRCLLGRWATDEQKKPLQRLTGNVYGGELAADAWVKFGNQPLYQAQANLLGVDLKRMVVERFGGQRDFNGKVDANVNLGGSGCRVDLLVGDGNIHIRDANLYELPLLVKLLKIVQTGAADTTAFTHSEIAFKLQGRHVLLDQIDFLGDVVNLYGTGSTDFDQNLDLRFSAHVGRNNYRLPFVKKLVKQANEQIMQMNVRGTMSQPEVTTEAFPGFSQMLHQIGVDLQGPAAAPGRQDPRGRVAAQPTYAQ